MKTRTDLKAFFEDGDRPTTGQFDDLIDSFRSLFEDADYTFKGIAIPATDPVEGTSNILYIATTAGTYTNFNSLVVAENEVCALLWTINPTTQIGAWTKIILSSGVKIYGNTLLSVTGVDIVLKCETAIGTPAYQWKYRHADDTAWSDFATGGTSATLTIDEAAGEWDDKHIIVMCEVTGASGVVVNSNILTVNNII